MTDEEFYKAQRRNLHYASRTRERPICRQQILWMMECRGFDLLQMWKYIEANKHKYSDGIIKQARRMFFSRRVREMRERQREARGW